MRLPAVLGLGLAVTALLACDESAAPPDAGHDAAVVAEDAATNDLVLHPVEPVVPPDLSPCPRGFRAVFDESGVTYCDAYGPEGQQACADGFAHFPGEPSCARVGPPCREDGWPAIGRAARALWVRRDAMDGDGSRPAPFGNIASAVAVAREGDVIALAVGRYEEAVRVPPGVSIVGACAEGTTITRVDDGDGAVVSIEGAGVSMRALSVSSPRHIGIDVVEGASLEMKDVRVIGGRTGIRASRATIVADTLTLSGRDSVPDPAMSGLALYDATATITRAIVEDFFHAAIGVEGLDASLTLDRSVVRISGAAPVAGGMSGLNVLRGDVVLRAVQFEGTSVAAINVQGLGALVTLDHVLVRRVLAEETLGIFGAGLAAASQAEIVGHAVAVLEATDTALYAKDPFTRITLTDALVARTRPRPVDALNGRGASAYGGATFDFERVRIDASHGAGVSAEANTTNVFATDLEVTNTVGSRASSYTMTSEQAGMFLEFGARAVLERARFRANATFGIAVFSDSVLEATDLVVEGSLSNESGQLGRGLEIDLDSSATLRRATFSRNREVSIFAWLHSRLDAEDLRIEDSLEASCAETSCGAMSPGGLGFVAGFGSIGRLHRFVVSRSALCGALLAVDDDSDPDAVVRSELDLSFGELRDNPIALSIQVDDYDFARLSDEVRFIGNDSDLSSMRLPVPEPLVPVEP